MKKAAIQKSRIRLARANQALDKLCKSQNFDAFSEAWTDFLLAANSIFSILEKGALSDATTKQWFFSKKKQARKDPLVRYMVQARNADEHGIEPVAEPVPGHIAIGVGGESVYIKSLTIGGGHVRGEILPVEGRFPTVEIQNAHPRLITVKDDRFGDSFDPPAEHLGKKLSDASPLTVATLMMRYLSGLIDEAANLAP